MRLNPALAALLLAFAAAAVAAEDNPVRHHPGAESQASIRRVIVKFRETGSTSRVQAQAAKDHVAAVVQRNGLSLKDSHAIIDSLHVMTVQPDDAAESTEATLAHLRADPDVEY